MWLSHGRLLLLARNVRLSLRQELQPRLPVLEGLAVGTPTSVTVIQQYSESRK
jgi:hypothetical protein